MFERKHEKLAPVSVFIKRLAVSILLALLMITVALFLGIAGYHWIGGFSVIDSILEASMILGGMGPIKELHTTSAKLFASGYALFSGLMFIALVGIVLGPLAHRFLHKFHIEN